jgi:hypothetical protein
MGMVVFERSHELVRNVAGVRDDRRRDTQLAPRFAAALVPPSEPGTFVERRAARALHGP